MMGFFKGVAHLGEHFQRFVKRDVVGLFASKEFLVVSGTIVGLYAYISADNSTRRQIAYNQSDEEWKQRFHDLQTKGQIKVFDNVKDPHPWVQTEPFPLKQE